jgi:hypothetical protein
MAAAAPVERDRPAADARGRKPRPASGRALLAGLGPAATVASCKSRGWLGLRNSVLLETMAEAGFRALVTADTRLWRERGLLLTRLRIGVVLVREPRTASDRSAAIVDAIRRVEPGQMVELAA